MRGEGCHDPLELRDQVAAFFKALRSEVGELPYLWVPEWHPGGHGLHLHFAVGRYVSQPLIRDLWGHGFVHIKLLGNLPVGSGVFEEARLAARYLSKYVTKNVGEERVSGLHRYEVAQGFQPEAVPLLGRSMDTWSSRHPNGWAPRRSMCGGRRSRMGGRGRPRTGLPGQADELKDKARAWVERSCLDQQIPTKVADPKALDDVAAIVHAQSPDRVGSGSRGGGAGSGGRPVRGG